MASNDGWNMRPIHWFLLVIALVAFAAGSWQMDEADQHFQQVVELEIAQ